MQYVRGLNCQKRDNRYIIFIIKKSGLLLMDSGGHKLLHFLPNNGDQFAENPAVQPIDIAGNID